MSDTDKAAWHNGYAKGKAEAAAEIERLRAIHAEIWQICHIPTAPAMKAYTHFQRDFDRIRELTAPLLEEQGIGALDAATSPETEPR